MVWIFAKGDKYLLAPNLFPQNPTNSISSTDAYFIASIFCMRSTLNFTFFFGLGNYIVADVPIRKLIISFSNITTDELFQFFISICYWYRTCFVSHTHHSKWIYAPAD